MSCYKENHKGFFSIKEKTNFTSPLPYYETYATKCLIIRRHQLYNTK